MSLISGLLNRVTGTGRRAPRRGTTRAGTTAGGAAGAAGLLGRLTGGSRRRL
jgi:hypothetical protein